MQEVAFPRGLTAAEPALENAAVAAHEADVRTDRRETLAAMADTSFTNKNRSRSRQTVATCVQDPAKMIEQRAGI